MRRIACALGGIVLATCCSQNILAAESSGSSWWPWGHKEEAKKSTPAPLGTGGSTPLATHQTGAASSATPQLGGAYSATTPIPGQPQAQSPADHVEKESWMLNSPKGKVSWPRLSNPFASKQKEAADPRNSWVEKTPERPKPSPMKPITDGAHKVATGTKNAWHKTVDALTPGESKTTTAAKPSPRVAKREVDPPFWKRMLGAKEEPQQPQTVPEWMAQQRLDP